MTEPASLIGDLQELSRSEGQRGERGQSGKERQQRIEVLGYAGPVGLVGALATQCGHQLGKATPIECVEREIQDGSDVLITAATPRRPQPACALCPELQQRTRVGRAVS
jgi:hypothetical protein